MDCTLRDGGYRNNWKFNRSQIKNIILSINESKIEYIECGYLTFESENDLPSGKPVSTKFSALNSFNSLISEIAHSIRSELFLMIDLKDINRLNLVDKNSQNQYLEGIRLAFHKKDFQNINNVIKKIVDKGYKLCLQPMVTQLYSETELLQLIDSINEPEPEAFYIVDSFGNMDFKGLDRLFSLIDKYLKPSVAIGFHPHNNLQMAFANAVHFMNINTSRKIIIDSTVSGIGRGAGNLYTEQIISHLNNDVYSWKKNKNYDLIPVLQIIDDVLTEIFPEKDFRNNTAYFLAAVRGCHPAYPAFFTEKGNLKIASIYHLINNIDPQQLNFFNREYAEKLLSGSG